MSKAKAVAGLLVFAVLFYVAVVQHHVGAPAPSMPCPAPYHLVTSWYPDSELARAEAGGKPPGRDSVIRWFGSTELVGCGQSLTATTGANP